jgi:hypothetical protein
VWEVNSFTFLLIHFTVPEGTWSLSERHYDKFIELSYVTDILFVINTVN